MVHHEPGSVCELSGDNALGSNPQEGVVECEIWMQGAMLARRPMQCVMPDLLSIGKGVMDDREIKPLDLQHDHIMHIPSCP